jgi:hypothetical protein
MIDTSIKPPSEISAFLACILSLALHAIALIIFAFGSNDWTIQNPQATKLKLSVRIMAAQTVPIEHITDTRKSFPSEISNTKSNAVPHIEKHLPEDRYLPVEELDEAPTLLDADHLERIANIIKGNPKLVLTIFIDQFGDPQNIEIESNETDNSTHESLTDLLLNTKFSPGIRNGKPVKSIGRYILEVEIAGQ